jgi:hypothetical protein
VAGVEPVEPAQAVLFFEVRSAGIETPTAVDLAVVEPGPGHIVLRIGHGHGLAGREVEQGETGLQRQDRAAAPPQRH